MNQIHLTLNQEEMLQLLAADRSGTFAKLLQECLNAILRAESAEQLRARPYERTAGRTGSRNGYRERVLTTRVGQVVLRVPKHRGGQPFHTAVFKRYSRSEETLMAAMAEMVVNGVSTRKVSQVMETLCGRRYSKSTVSKACRELDSTVQEFQARPLSGVYPFLSVDATYFMVRKKDKVIPRALMVACAVSEDGVREIIGFDVYCRESKRNWNSFLQRLKNRGLTGVRLITSDANEGLQDAIKRQFPTVAWQRCQFHFAKKIAEKAPRKWQPRIRTMLREMFRCATVEKARRCQEKLIAEYQSVAPDAMHCLSEGFESAMTIMALPDNLRERFRTSNHLERLNKELKRRSKAIGVFPNEDAVTRLMGSVLLELNDLLTERRRIFSPAAYRKLQEEGVLDKLASAEETIQI